MTIADVVLPTLVYAVPSGGASHIQFPVIGIGNYIHALLTGQRILPACLVVLPVVPNSSRGKIIVGKDIVNVRWGSSVTSVENANVQHLPHRKG